MSGLKVEQPGIFSLLQDGGRFGHHNIGLTTGGPMDRDAFRWANRLCGNSDDCAAIELMMGGLVLTSQIRTRIAVTGADMVLTINKVPQELWQTHIVEAGDRIELGFASSGLRCYLAVSGGFQADPVFGSVANVAREGLGGHKGDGSRLAQGDQLACRVDQSNDRHQVAFSDRPVLSNHAELRVIPGYQQHHFPRLEQRKFFASTYTVSDRSDRMGCRVEGTAIQCDIAGMLSEGICLGAIQIPADGQPIILLRDRQTIGGYPKIGSVLSTDLDKLAQLPPGSTVSFSPISVDEAHNLLALHCSRLAHSQLETL